MRYLDTLSMSLQAIRANKLRSSLTLFGVVLGVASIIGVMTGVEVIQRAMEKEMSVLGAQTFQVQKWPSGFSSDEERREAMRWPAVTLADAQAIRDQVDTVDIVGSEIWQFGITAEYNGESTNGSTTVCGGTPEYPQNNSHFVSYGRNISQTDVRMSRKVVVIGHALAELLYPFVDPIGRDIRIDGRRYQVIGVFEEKNSAFNSGYDNYVLMPVSTFVATYGMRDPNGFERSVNITVHAKTPELIDDAIEETRQVMRRQRNVPRGEKDNFELFNSASSISQFNAMTAGVKVAAFIIGTIALLVAGIGIMNIMLVSVTERTREIGIRKAIGAVPRNILRQFLAEAVILCNVGGIIGVVVGMGLANILMASAMPGTETAIPLRWAVTGLLFCTGIGVLFGMLPAMKAARLTPVDALRYD